MMKLSHYGKKTKGGNSYMDGSETKLEGEELR
jgi:hypothetical protein